VNRYWNKTGAAQLYNNRKAVESYRYDQDSTIKNKDIQRKYIGTNEIKRGAPSLNTINIIKS